MFNIKNKKEKWAILLIIVLIIILVAEIVLYNMPIKSSVSNSKTQSSDIKNDTNSNVDIVSTQTVENVLSTSGQVQSGLTEKLSLHASYYLSELIQEENKLIKEGENILSYTNGTYLKAPYDCVIISTSLPDEGDICTTSNYVEVQSLHNLSMSLNISESDINKVEVGDEVNITITSTEEKLSGKITSISEVGSYSSSGSYFTSTVSFVNTGDIKIGMSATCDIIVEKAENVLAVKSDAVQKSDSGKYVIVSSGDGTTENVYVETGVESEDYIEIKSGLSEGQKVVIPEADLSTSSDKQMQFPGEMGGGGFSGGNAGSTGKNDFSKDMMQTPEGGM